MGASSPPKAEHFFVHDSQFWLHVNVLYRLFTLTDAGRGCMPLTLPEICAAIDSTDAEAYSDDTAVSV